jgi:microcystin-dependent protein
VAVAGVLGWSATLTAQESWVPDGFNFFSAGSPAVASEVNANFRWVVEHVREAAPPGTVVAFAGGTIPVGWLLCDGRAVSQADYPELAAALGTSWGPADAGGSFTLPDFRGQFLRGVDDGLGVDPDSPRVVGSAQGFAIENIVGVLPEIATNTFSDSPLFRITRRDYGADMGLSSNSDADAVNTFTFDASAVVDTATETRPTNRAVQFIVKY